MAMSKKHKDALIKNRVALVNTVVLDEDFFSYMMDVKPILTSNMKEEIEAKATRSTKVGKLLEILPRRGPDAMPLFIRALVFTHQEHIANSLDLDLTNAYLNERGISPVQGDVDDGISVTDNSASRLSDPTSSLPKLSAAQKLQEIQYGNDKLIERAQQLDDKDPLLAKIVDEMKTGDAYELRSRCRGGAVILSFKHFSLSKHEIREGTDDDKANLEKLLNDWNFYVSVGENLADRATVVKFLLEQQKEIQKRDVDIFFLFIMSHGDDGCFFTSDSKPVQIKEVLDMFDGNNCHALYGKPKLFFIQACQGSSNSKGARPCEYKMDDVDGPENKMEMPDAVMSCEPSSSSSSSKSLDLLLHEKLDYLVGKASVSGFTASRHREWGTLYIRCLIYVFSREAHRKHVEEMLLDVKNVMSNFRSQRDEVFASENSSTLRKKLYILPGFPGLT